MGLYWVDMGLYWGFYFKLAAKCNAKRAGVSLNQNAGYKTTTQISSKYGSFH